MKKKPLIDILLDRKLVLSRDKGKALIMAAQILVSGQAQTKPGESFPDDIDISVLKSSEYVGRGADKLLAALDAFELSPKNRVCADIGSSTGGFTDVLLQRGAKQVFAVDSAYGELDWKLRSDDRVVVMERTNALHLEGFAQAVEFIVIDVSLLSLVKLLPALKEKVVDNADWVALVKPQYEARQDELPPGAVITDPNLHRVILSRTLQQLESSGFFVHGLIESPIKGGKGNTEFLACFGPKRTNLSVEDYLERLFEGS